MGLLSFLVGMSIGNATKIKNTYSLNFKNPYSLKFIFFLWKYLTINIKAYDIIHVHLFPSILYLSIFKFLGAFPKNVKIIMTEHNTFNRRRHSLIGKFLDNIIYRQYDLVVAISHGVKNSLVSYIGKLKKIEVINNGIEINFEEFYKREKREKIIIVSVGRLHKQKNYENAFLAISKIKDLNFEYWIVGSGEMKKYGSIINSLKIENKVKLLGFRKDVVEILKKSDIFLMPSNWEGFGLSAAEAMNAGLACIFSNVEGLRDLLHKNNYDGKIVDPSDPENMSLAIKELLGNYNLRQKLGRNAFLRSDIFSIQNMLKKHVKLYETIND